MMSNNKKSILKSAIRRDKKRRDEMEWSKCVTINTNKNQVCWYSEEKNCLYLSNRLVKTTEITFPLSKGIKRKFSEIFD